ncbi:RagB/SusD family nutrient uptake outer membrane protein [Chitinophaga sp.]|uniref:RagB/SusD family nutrient uptake outer membrane protein n=1 Tax=Chitinophaga sp. TaxID=1869181 RepID=UPI002639B5BF|nr:RagB/SusD family nutrient uptake outer membrane protein [uncultured Chitinophaga sp.]
MKKRKLAILSIPICLAAASCMKPLNVVPVEFKSAQFVFSDSGRAELFINNAYTDLPADVHNSFNWLDGNAMLASATDEAMHVSTNKTVPSAAQRMSAGNWNPSNMKYWRAGDGAGEIGSWMKYGGYHGNRKANTAIKNLHLLPSTVTDRFRNRMMGEALFLRALHHWFLFQRWGGIPIVDRSFEASEDVLIPRNSVKSVVDFIVRDCDAAFALLPEEPYYEPNEVGRADRGSCLALKAKILLYAASPLYNRAGADSLTAYTTPVADRWAIAAKAAQDVVDLNWYTLYKPGTNGQTNYASFFNAWGAGTTNRELIFARLRTPNRETENDNFPAGFTNARGGTCPSQDLVDAYEMADGTLFSWNNPTHAAAPYANRDPRFYASIIYNGARYNPFAGQNNYTFQIYTGGVNASGNAKTETGYYLNKFMDYANVNPAQGSGNTYHNWVYFRYAEVLLNLAEAGNEAGGPTYTAPGTPNGLTPVQALNLVRERAGMPSVETALASRGVALNQSTLRDFIRNERRIELAFEDHRYFDVRRWMTIETMPKFIRGVEITRNGDGTFTYDPTVQVEQKLFEKKHYFFPIPQIEMNRNPQMRQNPDWQ